METTPSHSQSGSGSSGNFMRDLEHFFDTYLHKKVPFHLPPAGKEFLVKYGPWIILVLLVLSATVVLPAALLVLHLSTYTNYYGYVYYAHYSAIYSLSMLLALASLVMEAFAIPGLLKRSLAGWHLLYYAVLLSALGQLINFDWANLIIGLVISMYLLFQIREYYK